MHRDLKPDNIFLTRQDIVKLGDFGVSKVLNHTKAQAVTFTGTYPYISPEVWSRQPYNWKSDIWALGIVLYQMAALRPPFFCASIIDLQNLIIRGRYPDLPQMYSGGLKNIVALCL